MKTITICRAVAAVACAVVLGAYAAADTPRTVDVRPGKLTDALETLASQCGVYVLYPEDQIAGMRTEGVSGKLELKEAFRRLIEGTPLTMKAEDGGIVISMPVEKVGAVDVSGLRMAQSDSAQISGDMNSTASNSADASSRNSAQREIQEIVVTAQKREERLQDVPTSVSVMSGERLESMGVNSLSDLANYIPGLSIQNGGAPGSRTIVIRGLTTSATPYTGGPLVATYIDDAPVGASAGLRSAQFGLDLMPYDLERIEVLRGPQGTLYGSGAMGGIVKYVLRKPDLTEFAVRFGADTEYGDGSDGMTWVGRGAVNVPLVADKLGLRMSGFYRKSPGYIDNVGLGVNNANDSTQSGGRMALLWSANDKLSVQGTLMFQDIDAADRAGVQLNGATLEPIHGEYARSAFFLEPFKQKTLFGSLTIDWDLDFARVTSASSWSEVKSDFVTDLSPTTGLLLGIAGLGNPDGIGYSHVVDKVSKYTQEIRIASPETRRFQWMLGGIYTDETPVERYSWPTFTAARDPLPYNLFWYYYASGTAFKERAAFGNVTYKLTDKLDLSGGLRYAENKEALCIFSQSVYFNNGLECDSRPYHGVTTWMTNARLHLTEDKMVYVRVATGYRPGGGCTGCGIEELETPDFYYSDDITNYEAGFKGDFLDRRLQIDLSVFHIDWSDIQITLGSPKGAVYTGNGGSAASTGAEFASTYLVTSNLRFNATLAYTDARLTEDAPGIGGRNGDQLPVSPRFTGSLTADYRRPLAEDMALVLGGGYRYRDAVNSNVGQSPRPLGPQKIVDTYVGIGKDRLTARLYGRNILNDRSYAGLLQAAGLIEMVAVPIQPRTIGLSVDYQF